MMIVRAGNRLIKIVLILTSLISHASSASCWREDIVYGAKDPDKIMTEIADDVIIGVPTRIKGKHDFIIFKEAISLKTNSSGDFIVRNERIGCSCSFDFNEGKSYKIYLNEIERSGTYELMFCKKIMEYANFN